MQNIWSKLVPMISMNLRGNFCKKRGDFILKYAFFSVYKYTEWNKIYALETRDFNFVVINFHNVHLCQNSII